MNARRLLAVPLLALTLLGAAATTAAAAEPFPQSGAPAASAVPFGEPFRADPFYEDFFSRADAHQGRALPAAVAAPHCPPPAGGADDNDTDALLDSSVTSSTSIL